MEKGNFSMLGGIFLRVNGQTTKQMDMEYIYILMVQNIKDHGKIIYSMGLANNNGKMDLNILEIIYKVKNMEKENINGLLNQYLKVNGFKITLMAMYINKGTYVWPDGRKYIGFWKNN